MIYIILYILIPFLLIGFFCQTAYMFGRKVDEENNLAGEASATGATGPI